MPKLDSALIIIPTVRKPEVISHYIHNAIKHNVKLDKFHFLILTEDFADRDSYRRELKENNVSGEVMDEKSRNRYLKENRLLKYKKLVPRRSHAETSFGLIYMQVEDSYEFGFMLDDDTRPVDSHNFFGEHLSNLRFTGEIESVASDKNWVNVLYQSFRKHGLYPRGFPYSKMGEKTIKNIVVIHNEGDVYLSQGLWTNVPDLDAIRILMDGDLNGQSKTRLTEKDFEKSFTIAKGNYTTVCSMNIAFREQLIPAFYQFPMDDNPYGIGRFDDIWSGIIAKKVMDSIGKFMISGYPLCEHNKAQRSTFKDLMSEAPGYESNENISDTVAGAEATTSDITELTSNIAVKMQTYGRTAFVKYCGKFLEQWCEMISSIG